MHSDRPVPSADVRRLALAAIGVVYGDIGTSPLYTLRECFGGHGLPLSAANVLGVLSLVLWSLIIVVTVKYIVVIMRADNQGEGGILALMALARQSVGERSRWVVIAGLFGAALFLGDGIITPAISVLSAVEGLTVVAPGLHPFVLPATVTVLLGLFAFQYLGTDRVGAWFGPVMVVWFAVLAVLGLLRILDHPSVLAAIDPRHALAFFRDNGFLGFATLGAVVLAVTGGEALYADMGHFGAKPIRIAWLGFVLPSLVLNYFGQSALVLADPTALANPFYLLAPEWSRLPLVALATAATVIASQAVISGAFSITQQAIQLGFCPRMEIKHTSEQQIGQIYLPEVNERLLFGVIVVVLLFKSSSNLASAYGIAITGTMTATTLLALVVARHRWRWSLPSCVLVFGGFLVVDLGFLGANLLKVWEGGWLPLLFAAALCLLMTTWRQGREILARRLADASLPIALFLRRLRQKEPLRVPGTAIYFTRHTELLPNALLHNLKHNKILHERIVLLTVETAEVPRVETEGRVRVKRLRPDFYRVFVAYGFMETPDVPAALALCARHGLRFDALDTSYFLGRETLIPSVVPPMSRWRQRLFFILSRNAVSATDFFRIPTDRVVELGAQVPM